LGIPTDLSLTASGIEVPLPQDSADPQITTLLAAGLTGVNMGLDVVAAWDETAKQINVSKLAMSAVDLGSMAISATVGNATELLFAVDPNVAMTSAFALTVKDVTINVTDDGLGKIVWPLAAAEQGQTDVDAYRKQMAGFAEPAARVRSPSASSPRIPPASRWRCSSRPRTTRRSSPGRSRSPGWQISFP
jgi:hypothetical protein